MFMVYVFEPAAGERRGKTHLTFVADVTSEGAAAYLGGIALDSLVDSTGLTLDYFVEPANVAADAGDVFAILRAA